MVCFSKMDFVDKSLLCDDANIPLFVFVFEGKNPGESCLFTEMCLVLVKSSLQVVTMLSVKAKLA
jgi:hypothetical protein